MKPRGEPWGFGVVAQLGERLHGMQEVTGSSPVYSIASDHQRSAKSLRTEDKVITNVPRPATSRAWQGGVRGCSSTEERWHRTPEVAGSNPVFSTSSRWIEKSG